jgi:hypothetical protein
MTPRLVSTEALAVKITNSRYPATLMSVYDYRTIRIAGDPAPKPLLRECQPPVGDREVSGAGTAHIYDVNGQRNRVGIF